MAKRTDSAKKAPKARRAGPDAASLAEYVEQSGMAMERLGMPRIAGKLVGYLLVCEPPHQTQAQLVEALGASKGSISTLTRHLEQSGVIERVRPPGEKLDYLRMPNAGFSEAMVRQMELRRRTIGELVASGLALLEGAPPARSQRLRSVGAFHEFMNAELQAVIGRWLAKQQDAQRPGGTKVARHSKKQAR